MDFLASSVWLLLALWLVSLLYLPGSLFPVLFWFWVSVTLLSVYILFCCLRGKVEASLSASRDQSG
jgi:hypothetical protein